MSRIGAVPESGQDGWRVPLVAFAITELLLVVLARLCGFDVLSPQTWERWDSGYYIHMVDHGYSLVHCKPEDPTFWCGTAGWFPGVSWLIALMRLTGISLHVAAVLVVTACYFGIVFVFYQMVEQQGPRGLVALAVACFFPGSIYLHAVFPLAPLVLAALLALYASSRGRFVLAAVFSMVAATMYPVGVMVGGAIALAGSGRGRWLAPCGTTLGLGLIVLAQYRGTGVWNGYWLIQHQYDHGLHNPFDTLGFNLKSLVNSRHRSRYPLLVWPAFQTLLVTVFVGWIGAHTRQLWREGGLTRLVLTYTALAWLFPLVVGGARISLYRSEVALLPAVYFVPRLPLRVSVPACAVLVVLFAVMERYFLLSQIM